MPLENDRMAIRRIRDIAEDESKDVLSSPGMLDSLVSCNLQLVLLTTKMYHMFVLRPSIIVYVG